MPISDTSADKSTPAVGGDHTAGGVAIAGASPEGRGVEGRSEKGVGVVGISQDYRGIEGRSTNEHAILGRSTKGAGVAGISEENRGVHGRSDKAQGVLGQSKKAAGVAGTSEDGPGVVGRSTNGSGVIGRSENGMAGSFEGDVSVAGELTIQGVNVFAMVRHIRLLEEQVDRLNEQLLDHIRNHSGQDKSTRDPFTIHVKNADGKVTVDGDGFRGGVTSYLFVAYPDLSYKKFDHTPDREGRFDWSIKASELCIPGFPALSLRFTVNQPDAGGRDRMTNSVTQSISC